MSGLTIDHKSINGSSKDLQQIESDRKFELLQEDETVQESSISLQFIYDDDNSTDSLIEEKIKEFRLDHNENHEDEESEELDQIAKDFELKIGKTQIEWGNNNQRESFKEIEEEATEEEAATEEEHDDEEKQEENRSSKCSKNYSNMEKIRRKASLMEQNDHEINVDEVQLQEESIKENVLLISEKPKDLGERTLSLSKLKASLAVFQSAEKGWIKNQQDTLEEQIIRNKTILKDNEEEEDISLSRLFVSKNEQVFCQSSKYAQISTTRTIPQDLSEREVRFLKQKSDKQHDKQTLISNMSVQEKAHVSDGLNCYSNGFKDNSFRKNTAKQQQQQCILRNDIIPQNILPEEKYSSYLDSIHAAKGEGSLFSDQEYVIKETPGLKESNRTQSKYVISSNGAEFTAIKSIPLNHCVGNEENPFENTMDFKLKGQRSNTSSLSPKYRKGNYLGYVESKSTSAASCFLTSSQSNNNSQGTFSNFHFSSAANTGSIFLDNSVTQTFLNNSRNLHHYHHHPNYYVSSSSSSNKTMNVSSALTSNSRGLVVSIKRNHNNNLNSSNNSDQSRSASKSRGFRRSNSINNSFTNCSSSAANSFDLNSQKNYQKGRSLLYSRGIIQDNFNSRNSISPTQIHQQSIRNRSQQKPQNRSPGISIFVNKKNNYENRRKQHSLSQDGHTRSSTDDKIFYKLNVTSSYEYPVAETQPSIEPRNSLNDVFTRNLLTSSLNLNISSNMQNNSNNTSNSDFNQNSKIRNNHASISNFHGQTPQRTMIPNQNAYAKMNGKFKRTAMIYLNSNFTLQKQQNQSYVKHEATTGINQLTSSLQSTICQPSRTKIRILLSAKQQKTATLINNRKSAGTPEIEDIHKNQHTLQTLPSAFCLAAEHHKHHLSQGDRENNPENQHPKEQIQQNLIKCVGNNFEKERSSELQYPQLYLQDNSSQNNKHLVQQNYPPPPIPVQQQQLICNPFNLLKQQNIFSGRGGGVLGVRSSGQPRKSSSTLHNYLKSDQNQVDYSINSLSGTGIVYNQHDISQNQSYLRIQNPTTKSKSQFRTSSELRGRPPRRQGGSVQHNIMESNNNSFSNSSHNSRTINHNARSISKQFSQDRHPNQITSMMYLQNKNNNNNSSEFLQFTSSVCEKSSWKSPKQKKQKETNKRVLSQEDDRSYARQAVY